MRACIVDGEVGVGFNNRNAAGAQALLQAERPPLIGVPRQQPNLLLALVRPQQPVPPLCVRRQALWRSLCSANPCS